MGANPRQPAEFRNFLARPKLTGFRNIVRLGIVLAPLVVWLDVGIGRTRPE